MPASARWSWVEAYGMIDAPPQAVHGDDWDLACGAVRDRLDDLISRDRLAAEHASASTWADRPPSEILQHGSGWGALEQMLRRSDDVPEMDCKGTPFATDSLGPAQQPWIALLRHGKMPEHDPLDTPLSYAVGPRWTRRLAGAADWLGLLHLGVCHAQAGDPGPAREAWQRSVAAAPNPWALRSLGALALEEGDAVTARPLLQRAARLRPDVPELAHELLTALLASGDASGALEVLDDLPADLRRHSRIRIAEVRAAASAGDLGRAETALEHLSAPPDLREGENTLHELFYEVETLRRARALNRPADAALRREVRETTTVPRQFEFRMSTDLPPS